MTISAPPPASPGAGIPLTGGRRPVRSERHRDENRRCLALTERDVDVVAWLGRQRMATAEHVRRRFSLSRTRAYHLLSRMVDRGLVVHRRIFVDTAGVYLTTRPGLWAAGLDLPPATVDPRTFRHDTGVTGLVVAAEAAGQRVTTEREARSADTASGAPARFSVTLGSGVLAADGSRLHFPDLVVEGPGPRVAVELELTPKRSVRLAAILSAYGWASHFDIVAYHVGSQAIGDKVRAAADRLGLGPRVAVVPWKGER